MSDPFRTAAEATTPQTSAYTSTYEQIQAEQPSPPAPADTPEPATPIQAERRGDRHRLGARGRDGWLSPVELQPDRKAAVATRPGRRASDKGFLPVSLREYLRLLDWTGRQSRPDKLRQIPGELALILARLQLSAETWVDTVLNFGRWHQASRGSGGELDGGSRTPRPTLVARVSA